MKRARKSGKRGRWLSEYVSREPCWNPHSAAETLNDLQRCEQLSPFPPATQVDHRIHLQLILSEACGLLSSTVCIRTSVTPARTGQGRGDNYSPSPFSSLNRPNKLRDHGNWLSAVFVRGVCAHTCVCERQRRELEGWGGFTLHELMNFAVMIFKSRMIPAGINNYILVILLSERRWERAGCG